MNHHLFPTACLQSSPEEKTDPSQRTEARSGKETRREAGSVAVRAGHARSFRKKRTDDRRRPGPGCADLPAQKRAREVATSYSRDLVILSEAKDLTTYFTRYLLGKCRV